MDTVKLLETGAAALVFAAVFLFGERIRPMHAVTRDETILLSLSSGVALAYVFVHVMPELSGARITFVQSTVLPKMFNGMIVYILAMVGFLVFYTLDEMGKRARVERAEGEPAPGFDVKLAGFTGYVALISYLLVNNLENSPLASAAYALAMAVHFVTFDHGFRLDKGSGYARVGHKLLAVAVLVGWGLGLAFEAPKGALALMLGFLSGGVIVNTAITELPSGMESKLWPFLLGAVVYAALLIGLG